MRFTGLLVHAVDRQNATVGSFHFPEKSGNFGASQSCPGAAVHSHAALKPYHTRLRFVAPPKGAGTIRFRVLIKFVHLFSKGLGLPESSSLCYFICRVGPANDGAFFYPSADLVLGEGPPVDPVGKYSWQLAPLGVDCASHCSQSGLFCDQSAMEHVGPCNCALFLIPCSCLEPVRNLIFVFCLLGFPAFKLRFRKRFKGRPILQLSLSSSERLLHGVPCSHARHLSLLLMLRCSCVYLKNLFLFFFIFLVFAP